MYICVVTFNRFCIRRRLGPLSQIMLWLCFLDHTGSSVLFYLLLRLLFYLFVFTASFNKQASLEIDFTLKNNKVAIAISLSIFSYSHLHFIDTFFYILNFILDDNYGSSFVNIWTSCIVGLFAYPQIVTLKWTHLTLVRLIFLIDGQPPWPHRRRSNPAYHLDIK